MNQSNVIQFNPTQAPAAAKLSPTSEAVFFLLTMRERNSPSTDLRRIRQHLRKEGFHVVPEAVVDTFKALETMGAGTLVYGKRGHAKTFKWKVPLKDVAKAAHLLPKELPKEEPVRAGLRTVIVLADSRRAIVEIPNDLTPSEAELVYKTAIMKRSS